MVGMDQSPNDVQNVKSVIGMTKMKQLPPEENGLRRRKKKLYEYSSSYWDMPSVADYWNRGLADKFLNLNPRPSVEELRQVVYPPCLIIGLTSQN